MEWPLHGNDAAETRFSVLAAIDTTNVARLELVWSYDPRLAEGRLEATPIVHDGIIYATGTWSVFFAVDARSGREKWRWDPGIVRGGAIMGGPSLCCGPVNRGVAVHNGKVFGGLLDGRLAALDAVTGAVIWVRQTTPPGSDYSITGAPRIVDGKVIIGNGGADYGVRGFVSAFDPDTGRQLWRFYTVPGDPAQGFESPALAAAATTWQGEWWRLGGGGTAWDGMAYDPDAKLLYIGTGNGSPWSREQRSPGGGDNLFLSSILALDPDNGDLRWHYQTTPGDDWDYTATQNLVLAELELGGRARRVIMQAAKNGFYYVLDRLTGEFISAAPFTSVTWATGIDPESGRPIETPWARYGRTGSWISPAPHGAHAWEPMSWHPKLGLAFIPGQSNAQIYRTVDFFPVFPGRLNIATELGDLQPGTLGIPPADRTPRGFLVAWDPVTQSERWRINFATGTGAGSLATAGGLVFSGAGGGRFFAANAATGEILWETTLAPGVGSPVMYEVDGRQYVAVLAGTGASARLWVFALAE